MTKDQKNSRGKSSLGRSDHDSTERILPHSLEAERNVLGCILLDNPTMHDITSFLEPPHFYLEGNQYLFEAMLFLHDQMEEITEITVENILKQKSQFEAVGGHEVLLRLADSAGSPANIGHFARIIKEKYILREIIGRQNILIADAFQSQADPNEILNRWESGAAEMLKFQKSTEFSPISAIIPETLKYLDQHQKNPSLFAGVRTGLPTFDEMTTGMKGGDYIILAGRPSSGKTALCLQVARHVAMQSGQTVGMFSLEMSQQALAMRILSAEAAVSGQRMRAGTLTTDDWHLLNDAGNRLSHIDADILIDDTAGTNIAELRSKAKQMKQRQERLDKPPLGLIVIDYLQLLTLPDWRHGGRKADNRQQEIAEISRTLKILAIDLDVPILCLSQLNRTIENQPGRKPRLADLRESGAIEQDADVVCFINRPAKEQGEPDEDPADEFGHPVDLVIAKQRNGPTGDIALFFDKAKQHFGEITVESFANRN